MARALGILKDWRENITVAVLFLTLMVSGITTIVVHADGERAIKKAHDDSHAQLVTAREDARKALQLTADLARGQLDQAVATASAQHADTAKAINVASSANDIANKSLQIVSLSNLEAQQIEVNADLLRQQDRLSASLGIEGFNLEATTATFSPEDDLASIKSKRLSAWDSYSGAIARSRLVNPPPVHEFQQQLYGRLIDLDATYSDGISTCLELTKRKATCGVLQIFLQQLSILESFYIEEADKGISYCIQEELSTGHPLDGVGFTECLKKVNNGEYYKDIKEKGDELDKMNHQTIIVMGKLRNARPEP
jgi:hypothetical protein